MAIRSGGEVARLIADLRGADAVRREAAVARLRVIGERAVDALLAVATAAEPADSRVAALKALEGAADARVIDTALALASTAEPRVAAAAIDVLRAVVTEEPGTRVLEVLTTLSLDRQRDAAVRLAALDAIADLPRALVAPVLEQAALGPPSAPGADDPMALQEWLSAHGDAPLSDLHALVVRLRDNERADASAARRQQWQRARGAAHAALAARGSKVALYDLRESFDAADAPLPLDFLTAVTTIGDATCLEPMARAWAASPTEAWWRERLAGAAADIMHRARLSGRSALVKRIRARWPGFL